MPENTVKAVLIDVGQPLVEDSAIDRAWNDWLVGFLSDHLGREITLDEIIEKQEEAIRCYAPSIFSYVIWHYVKPDKKLFADIRGNFDSLDYPSLLSVRPEAVEVCERLSEKYILATAANQPAITTQILEDAGVLEHFNFKEMSGAMKFSKPDLRFFMHILDSIGVEPENAVMVGDRQDNDIVPAKRLGMYALRWKGGLFIDQEVRLPFEEPDGELTSLHELPELVDKLGS
jgi:8-oxo-dGTP diphosphatase/putative hydrolase of the HAD superfamily